MKLRLTVKLFAFLSIVVGCTVEEPRAVQAPAFSPHPTALAPCPVTQPPPTPFVPPPPHAAPAPYTTEFWFGTEQLWTLLPERGIWEGLPHTEQGYTQKLFWWQDTSSPFTVTGQGLDASAPALETSPTTNGYHEDLGNFILIGANFPTFGCWEITAHSEDSELTFVIWVAP
jgi:hypothetical protein